MLGCMGKICLKKNKINLNIGLMVKLQRQWDTEARMDKCTGCNNGSVSDVELDS